MHKLLHWVVAAAVIFQLYLGFELGDLPQESAERLGVLRWHATIGVTIFVLMLVRLAWRLTHAVPPAPTTLGPRLARVARAVHIAFYVVLLILPLSGLSLVAGASDRVPVLGIELPGFGPVSEALRGTLWLIHATVAIATSVMVVGHVCAAVRHAMLRDGTFSRMLPGG